MAVVLHHHPFTRARHVVWMLEEVGIEYTLSFVDLLTGEGHQDAHLERNRMGKLPVLEDDGALVSEVAAIGMYLADRYAPGRLAPLPDDPARGAYLRWCVFGPSVVEPGCMAKAAGWDFKPQSAGWGAYDDMVSTLEEAVAEGPWLLGDRFSMADVLLGGTVRWMLQFGMLKGTDDTLPAYAARLGARPAAQRSEQVNQRVIDEHGLSRG